MDREELLGTLTNADTSPRQLIVPGPHNSLAGAHTALPPRLAEELHTHPEPQVTTLSTGSIAPVVPAGVGR